MGALPISEIVVTNRHRKDPGDITALAESIKTVGLLHPVVVDSVANLVAGERRLAAVRLLGWTSVPVTVAETVDDATKLLVAERDENTCRKEMTFSELLPLKVALEALERPKAGERQGTRTDLQPRSNLDRSEKPEPTRTRHVVARALGKSATTMDKVEEVHRVAKAPETPEPVRKVAVQAIEHMDRTNKADPGFRAVKEAQAVHAIESVIGPELDADAEYQRVKYAAAVAKAMTQITGGLLTFEVERVAESFDEKDWAFFDGFVQVTEKWFVAVRAARPAGGLRLVNGGM